MPLDRINEPHAPIITEEDPVVLDVEIGKAVLNTVSHHEYLRCAKYVNPLVRQLSNQDESAVVSPTVVYNRNSLIILDADVVEKDSELDQLEHDVYEEQLDCELETSVHNGFKLGNEDDSDSTLSGNNEGDDESVVEVTVDQSTVSKDLHEVNQLSDNLRESYNTEDLINVSLGVGSDAASTVTSSNHQVAVIQKNAETEVNIANVCGTSEEKADADKDNCAHSSDLIKNSDESLTKQIVIIDTKKANMDLLGEIESELEMLRSHDDNHDKVVDGNDQVLIEDFDLVNVETVNAMGDHNENVNAYSLVTASSNKTEEKDVDDIVISKDMNENANNDVKELEVQLTEDTLSDESSESEDFDSEVTYKSTSFVILSPSVDRITTSNAGFRFTEDDDTPAVVKETEQVVETTNSAPEENALKVNGASEISENGISEEEAIHFAEMNNVRQKFESGKTSSEELTPKKISVKEEYDQGGEFENEPVRNPDVVREADQQGEDLPEVGTAKNLVSKFKSISEEKSKSVPTARPASPPRTVDKVEYESQPSEHLPQYEAKVESGVFESEPKGHEEVVVRSGDQAEDYKPEQGYAKNILNKFKEIQTESSKVQTNEKRELTPDRSGKIEYVSEPRGERIEYSEAKSESGVFENVPKSEEDVVKSGDKADEVLPEIGYAKSVLSKFKQMESEVGNKPPPSPKKDSTPDKSGRVEYVSEPRGYLERYEPQTESGEFENQPEVRGEVIKSGEATEEVLPEVGAAKKTMERFKEIQKQSSSPVSSSSRSKAMTPPRDVSPGRTVAGVVENQPAERDDVVKSGDNAPELLPEQGTTRNILNKFKEIQSSGSQTSSPGRKPKEFTPPPEAGVYENTPKEHLVVETRQSESGVLESTPSKSIADVAREREASPEAEMPEQGYAKNMVSKWRQLESTSAKSTSSTSPRYKEFTPPRDNRGPLSPKSPVGVTNGVHPSELPGQYQPQESSVIVENNPKVNEGIYREADTDWSAGMPAPNTTSSMLQKFKQIQSKAKEDESSQVPIAKKS